MERIPRIESYTKKGVARGYVLAQRLLKRLGEISQDLFKAHDRVHYKMWDMCVDRALRADVNELEALLEIENDEKLILTIKNGQLRNKQED